MTLLRALHSEVLKLKRTMALKMTVLSPAIVVLLILFIASQSPFTTLHRNGNGKEWTELARQNLWIWALLMLPLYITLESALVAGLDHSENQWKSLLARPVPRWTLYVAKLIVVMAMTAIATLALLLGILLEGAILPRLQSEAAFGFPVPWTTIFRDGAEISGSVFLALTIQHWVSLRWRSFSVAMGTGIVATVLSFFAAGVARKIDSWPQYFPWALPMVMQEGRVHHLEQALLISFAVGLVIVVAGCWDFCRREVA
jgi:hypothetical protein